MLFSIQRIVLTYSEGRICGTRLLNQLIQSIVRHGDKICALLQGLNPILNILFNGHFMIAGPRQRPSIYSTTFKLSLEALVGA